MLGSRGLPTPFFQACRRLPSDMPTIVSGCLLHGERETDPIASLPFDARLCCSPIHGREISHVTYRYTRFAVEKLVTSCSELQ